MNFHGLGKRLEKELQNLVKDMCTVKVIEPSGDGRWTVWVGASKMASSPEFPKMSLTKDQYDEIGPDKAAFKVFF